MFGQFICEKGQIYNVIILAGCLFIPVAGGSLGEGPRTLADYADFVARLAALYEFKAELPQVFDLIFNHRS